MIRLVMENSSLTMWPVLSFVVFFSSCLLMLAWLYRPGSTRFYGRLSRLALGDAPADAEGRE